MKLRFISFTVFLLLARVSVSYSQPNFQAGWNFALSFPGSDLQKKVNGPLPGWGLDFNYAIKGGHFLPGLSFVYLRFGDEDVRLICEDGIFDLETQNVLLQWHISFRYRFTRNAVQPYLEGLAGFHYLYTQTTVSDAETDLQLGGKINHDDLAFSYGAGAGMLVRLYNGDHQSPSSFLHNLQLFFDARARYVLGGDASYYRENIILPGRDTSELSLTKSSIDMFTTQAGLVLAF